MAYDVAVLRKISVGNQKCHVLSITADAATQNVDTGLSVVDDFAIGAQSITANFQCYANSGAGGTSLAGYLGMSGLTSGDVFYVRVYGR